MASPAGSSTASEVSASFTKFWQIPGITNAVASSGNQYGYISALLLSNGKILTWGYEEYGDGDLGHGIQYTGAVKGTNVPTEVVGITTAVSVYIKICRYSI